MFKGPLELDKIVELWVHHNLEELWGHRMFKESLELDRLVEHREHCILGEL